MDRSRRLIVCGALAVAAGTGLLALGALALVLPAALPELAGAALVDRRDLLAGAALYGLVGAALIWAGVGSIRRRRWVRPIMLLLAGTWLASGLLALPLAAWTLDAVLSPARAASPAAAGDLAGVVRWTVLAAIVAGAVFLPGALLWVYRDGAVQRTCDRHHRGPSWSDGCPPEVLALASALGAAGVVALPLALRPAVPAFGRLVTGGPGAAATLALGAACLWLARSTLRLERAGWWGALAFLAVTGVSTTWTCLVSDPSELYAVVGGTRAAPPALPEAALRWGAVAGSLGLTLAGLLYLWRVRGHFALAGTKRRGSPPDG